MRLVSAHMPDGSALPIRTTCQRAANRPSASGTTVSSQYAFVDDGPQIFFGSVLPHSALHPAR